MPNHVANILIAHGDEKQVRAMFEAVKNDKIGIGSLDFNKIIPMPENIFRGNLGTEEFARYGKNNWYDWSVAHWGTKWNSYGYSENTPKGFDGSRIKFDTAWSSAAPVIEKLSSLYPELSFEYQWADENLGYNTGKKEYEHGKETFSFDPQGGSSEALELAAETHGIDLQDEGYLYNEKTGEYEYQEPPSMQLT
ncbi:MULTISPECIES: DUF1281 family ferredoxin-like fold protein [Caproicibacterium]|jgi:hypothetical protein|uniref:YubB ferredoxin-like domain-containing protein n=1 Tax=Caproicibacterium argilliputei TaxID=3030016 RepID=A0AA97H2E5_9FIRM|nr:hypothetical protein [Caproicibacterium argilliputei]WOC32132.1 hypothetical protein PXC00_13200 [Caproicibacterium argilliputei]